MAGEPLITCIMPTANRRPYVPLAIQRFLEQDYPNRELLIVDDGDDPVRDLVPNDSRIRYLSSPGRLSLGSKRNYACGHARGRYIAHWDDDDWIAPWRLSYQLAEMERFQADLSGLSRLYFWDPEQARAWLYVYPAAETPWVAGGTLCYRKSFWERNPFPDLQVGEDNFFAWTDQPKRLLALERYPFYVATVHRANTSPKHIASDRWLPIDVREIHETMGAAFFAYNGRLADPVLAPRRPHTRPTAVVAAAQGIGDIIRMTPMVRVLDRLGYDTDLLIEPDFASTVELLEGAPEIRRLYHRSSNWSGETSTRMEGLTRERYTVAVASCLGAPLLDLLHAERKIAPSPEEWLRLGDSACLEQMARDLLWQEPIPEPFVIPSGRRFDIPPDTVAIHPGCKPNWPWKKWHGFDDLALSLPQVAVIGVPSDLDNAGAYFSQPFRWPSHARNYVGQLSLPDTAALLSQCAALVSNDSGVMHIGTALGIPTHGIFGITSPQREAIPAPNLFPITKQLPCEPACREKEWGRSNCEQDLECLRTLTAAEVLRALRPAPPAENEEPLRVVYCGPFLEASGYGTAARGYIRALHAAGVELAVIPATNPFAVRTISDPFIESLPYAVDNPDFVILHGIPPQWPELSIDAPIIGLTVWETDTVPPSWREALARVTDLWLPSRHNCDVFAAGCSHPIFRWPHIAPSDWSGQPSVPLDLPAIQAGDYVFYSIFEWQQRKAPVETILSFLDAFPEANTAILVLKTNPEIADAAEEALALCRKELPSQARVLIVAEHWPDGRIRALQARGDCYISLHRGEGWGYPLFEAACRGQSIIATAYSGPMEFLDPEHHALIPYTLGPVLQNYFYYAQDMQWAEPDWRAATAAIAKTYAARHIVRPEAQQAAAALRQRFSMDTIGRSARRRLLALRARARRQRPFPAAPPIPPPSVPIPGDWYDADYFDHGRKSNWSTGYTPESVGAVIGHSASWLCDIFPNAATFIDAGCARGYLVGILRDAGKQAWGFDHSPWAIQTADEQARPFLSLATVEQFRPSQNVDVLLAFDLLAHLTADQALVFLSNARVWTNHCLLATVPSPEDGIEAAGRDPSHVTFRTRAWWRDLFERAGWRQDFAMRSAERACQAHPFVAAMRWNVYLYLP